MKKTQQKYLDGISKIKLQKNCDFRPALIFVLMKHLPCDELPCEEAYLKGTEVVYIHNEILHSNKKECICISSNEVDEPRTYYTE